MIPDLFNYWLTGEVCCEYTDASTTQLMNPRTRSLGGRFDGAPEPADASRCADCGSRIDHRPASAPTWPAVRCARRNARHRIGLARHGVGRGGDHRARDGTAFISSGTWSLVGIELDAPVLTPRAMQLNFSNEGGVGGTTRLLKNVMGLWLLQGCRRSWARAGIASSRYGELMDAAAREPGFRHLVDPDDSSFVESRRHARRDRSFLPHERISQPRRRRARTRAPSSTAWR